MWEHALGQTSYYILPTYALKLAHAYQRLGDIYDRRGDKVKALEY